MRHIPPPVNGSQPTATYTTQKAIREFVSVLSNTAIDMVGRSRHRGFGCCSAARIIIPPIRSLPPYSMKWQLPQRQSHAFTRQARLTAAGVGALLSEVLPKLARLRSPLCRVPACGSRRRYRPAAQRGAQATAGRGPAPFQRARGYSRPSWRANLRASMDAPRAPAVSPLGIT